MKAMKKLGYMVALAGLLAVGSANASSLYGPSFSHNGANWDAIFGDNHITGAFNDIFPFYLPLGAGGDGGGSVISGFASTGPDVFISKLPFLILPLTQLSLQVHQALVFLRLLVFQAL